MAQSFESKFRRALNCIARAFATSPGAALPLQLIKFSSARPRKVFFSLKYLAALRNLDSLISIEFNFFSLSARALLTPAPIHRQLFTLLANRSKNNNFYDY
jgi:hypothetical protein